MMTNTYETLMHCKRTVTINDNNELHGWTEFIDGFKLHYENGKLSKQGAPAVIFGQYQAYYMNGLRHNENGPAVIADWGVEFWLNGELHNSNGAARKYADGKEEYFLHGERLKNKDKYEKAKQC